MKRTGLAKGDYKNLFRSNKKFHPLSCFPKDTIGSSSVKSISPEEVENLSLLYKIALAPSSLSSGATFQVRQLHGQRKPGLTI